MTTTPKLSPFGQGWMAESAGESLDDCPYTDELDLVESESRGEAVLARDRWFAGFVNALNERR